MPRLLFLLLFAVSACTAAPPVPPPSPSPSADACPTGVEYAVTGEEAASGLRVLTLELTNCGTEALRLEGYPSVTVLDADREPLTIAVGRGSFGISAVEAFDAEPWPVAVGPGESAVTGLLWRNTYTDTSAPPVVGEHLELAVATGRPAQVFTPTRENGEPVTIDLGSSGKLGLRPWTAAP
ncbi:DUF4232 domain-containing protein [Saccharothrix luteola]|uniref:DUF4232 domain-containing protein n=1 Tax=Saccharothrix luteola TaxID=2893018 RepID=UPI001E2A54EF|nr:DUF4232 domain-containing protein [Saccharothrix luteola]MCC8250226.1 DUF4232 domain-containing protein [Saccharothrix luteola]